MPSFVGRTGRELRRARSIFLILLHLLREDVTASQVRGLILAVLAVLGASLLAAGAPIIFKYLVDALAVGNGGMPSSGPVILASAYCGVLWLDRALRELRWLTFGRAEQTAVRRLGSRAFSHLLRLPLRFHLERRTGALNRTLVNGVVGYRLALEHAIFSILPAGLQILCMGAVLAHFYGPVFLAMLLLSAMGYVLVFLIGAARIARSMRAVSSAEISASATMTDALINYEPIKYFSAEGRSRARFDAALARCERRWLDFYRRQAGNGLAVAAIFGLSLLGAMLLAGRAATHGAMTIGDFVLVAAYMVQILSPMEALGFALRDSVQAMGFLEKLATLFEQTPENDKGGLALSPRAGTSTLVFEHVRFSYKPGQAVLDDLSFTIGGGTVAAIVGASGSGKSTLVRLLARLVDPDDGRILLDGIPIEEISLMSLRKEISVVPQDTLLLNDTIGANIGIDRECVGFDAVQQLPRHGHIHDLIARLPARYDTQVGERGMKLSGGERQCVAVARALIRKPRLFVFDEATSSLDARTEAGILEDIRRARGETTTLFVAHRLSMAARADEILVLDEGHLVERGSHATLLKRKGLYAEMWRKQMETSRETIHSGPALA